MKRAKGFWKWIVFAVVVIYCIVMLIVLGGKLKTEREKGEELTEQLEELNEEVERLKEEISYMGTDEYVEQVARDRLGMIYKDEKIFREKTTGSDTQTQTDDTAGETEATP